MGIVDRDEQEKIMVQCEQIFAKHDLMPDEKIFILNALGTRIKNREEKQKMSDLMRNSMTGGLLKSVMKKFHKSDDEEEDEK